MSILTTLGTGLQLSPRLIKACWQARRADQLEQAKQIDAPQLASWLSVPVEHIEAVKWENVHVGTTSRSRLLVDYRDTSAGLPDSFFVKATATTFSTRVFGNLFALGRNELNFYRTIRPLLQIRAPQVYHSDGEGEDFLLLLEDLAAAGCEFTDVGGRCSLERALSVVTTLARLHAQFWQSSLLQDDLAWVPRYETDRNQRLMSLLRDQSIDRAIAKYRQLVPAEIIAAAPLIREKYPLLEQRWAEGPRTLIHGDAHIGNMFFYQGQAGLLDWQVLACGQGMRDVSYFLVNSVPTEIRQQHQRTLIRHYLEVLAEQGVQQDFDSAWQQYRLHTAYTWISSIVTAAASHMQPAEIAAAGLARTCKALLDLDSISLIREL